MRRQVIIIQRRSYKDLIPVLLCILILGAGGFSVAINTVSFDQGDVKVVVEEEKEAVVPPVTPVAPTVDPETEPLPIPNPSLSIRLDYFGITSDFGDDDWDGSTGEIQLAAVITDGIITEEVYLPPDRTVFKMDDFEVYELDQPVFHTSSVGDFLKISVLVYDIDDQDALYQFADMGEALDMPEASLLKLMLSFLPQEDDRIGYYEHTWYPEQDWGIGQYSEKGVEHLKLWFSIWSGTEPPLISKPVLLPDVRIQSVNLPADAKKRGEYEVWYIDQYDTILRLVNNESVDIEVYWQAHSSVTGDFDSGAVTIPKNGTISIKEDYYYDTAGELEITYRIYFRGVELDSWSGTMTVAP